MVFNWPAASLVLRKDMAVSKIKAGDILSGRIFHGSQARRSILQGGYYTTLKFPPKAESGEARKAQEMNYEYCVQTMAGLMKKYAPEILK